MLVSERSSLSQISGRHFYVTTECFASSFRVFRIVSLKNNIADYSCSSYYRTTNLVNEFDNFD